MTNPDIYNVFFKKKTEKLRAEIAKPKEHMVHNVIVQNGSRMKVLLKERNMGLKIQI